MMDTSEVFHAAARLSGIQEEERKLRKAAEQDKAALIAEAKKVLFAGGVNAELSRHEEYEWDVRATDVFRKGDACVWVSVKNGYYGIDETYQFMFDDLVRADELAAEKDREEEERQAERRRRELEQRRQELADLELEHKRKAWS